MKPLTNMPSKKVSECKSCDRKSEILDLEKACPFCVPKIVPIVNRITKDGYPLNVLLKKVKSKKPTEKQVFADALWSYLNCATDNKSIMALMEVCSKYSGKANNWGSYIESKKGVRFVTLAKLKKYLRNNT